MSEPQEKNLRPIDLHAIRIPQQSGLPPCLYIPIAARSIEAIEHFVGTITRVLSSESARKAVLVAHRRREIGVCKLPIWHHEGASELVRPTSVWVHVDYSGYRAAYLRAFPDLEAGLVLDHVLNRRAAREKGFSYLRLAPVSRAVNSSHGGLSEKWGVNYHSSERMRAVNRASASKVQYADLSDLVKMMNMQGGGSFMEIVNDSQRLVDAPSESGPCNCVDSVPHYSQIPVSD